jgi:hypothetical protein
MATRDVHSSKEAHLQESIAVVLAAVVARSISRNQDVLVEEPAQLANRYECRCDQRQATDGRKRLHRNPLQNKVNRGWRAGSTRNMENIFGVMVFMLSAWCCSAWAPATRGCSAGKTRRANNTTIRRAFTHRQNGNNSSRQDRSIKRFYGNEG